MSVMYGADADELDRLANEFIRVADEIDGDSSHLSRVLGNVTWMGDFALRFTSDWTGRQLPQIGLSTRFLREAAEQLARNAAEQRSASDAGSGIGPGFKLWPNPVPGARRGPLEDREFEWEFQGESDFTGFQFKTGAVDGIRYGAGDDGIVIGEGDYGLRIGFDENGEPIAIAGVDASILSANLDGVIAGNENLGLTGGIESELLGADAFVGYQDGSVGAGVGVNFVSAGAEIGTNLGGVNLSGSAEIGLKAELAFKIGREVEVKLPFVSFGFSIGGAK